MNTNDMRTVTVNAGSSSIKLALFVASNTPEKVAEARVENIGQSSASLVISGDKTASDVVAPIIAPDHVAAARILTDWLRKQKPGEAIAAIGHRIVHGGPKYHEPAIIDADLLANLHELIPFDPEHLPVEIQLIEEFQKLFPDIEQVACFDTSFHHGLPNVAKLLPIPRHFVDKGVRRYGFHGLSYAFVLEELRRLEGADIANGKVIIAHLGSGVSLAAVRDGKSIDTTMGLTPAAGVPMSTRSGDLDPGLGLYLSHTEGYNTEQFNHMVNFKSGLLGISETSADMKQLLDYELDDTRAKDAVDLFCYQVKKSIGSLAAALGGLDTLVFTGGMGENAPKIRARICDGLEFLGATIEADRNVAGAPVISTDTGRVVIRIVHTDESSTIAQNVQQIMNNKKSMEHEVE